MEFQALAPKSHPFATKRSRNSASFASASRRDIEQGCDGARAIAACRLVERVCKAAFEPQILGEYQLSLAAHAPAIMQASAEAGLAHGEPPEDIGLERDQPGVAGHVHVEPAPQIGAIEQNGLLGQPGDRSAGCKRKRNVDFGSEVLGTIDPLGGLCRQRHLRSARRREGETKRVAAGNAAAGIDEDGLAARSDFRTVQSEAAALVKVGEAGPCRGQREGARISPFALAKAGTVQDEAGARSTSGCGHLFPPSGCGRLP